MAAPQARRRSITKTHERIAQLGWEATYEKPVAKHPTRYRFPLGVQPRLNALAPYFRLIRPDAGDDVCHQLPRWGSQVDPVPQADEIHAQGDELVKERR